MAPSLDAFSWAPFEDAFSAETNVLVSVSTANSLTGFFYLQIPTNGTLPAVQIFSPTNSQTVSGTIPIGVGAQIGSQLQGVNLYLDSALVGFIDSGGIEFDLDTTHFANGQHTVYVGAVDTANNETLSSSITLDFENPVRWLDADSLFDSFVPIDVTSDIFPASWLVSVTDTNGTIVRTISGSTPDGNIQTNWDGTDNNGMSLPVESLYEITVDVTGSGGSTMMMASSLASTLGATYISSQLNSHGVYEYTIQKPAPNPLTAYLAILTIYNQLTPEEKFIYPPLPDRPANDPYATTTVIMSTRDIFLASHQTSGTTLNMSSGTATPNGGSGGTSGSTGTAVWREKNWSSGEIVLARQKITGSAGLFFDGIVANLLGNVNTLVATAQDSVSGDRGTYHNAVLLMQQNGDFSSVTNALASSNPDTREFYFYGHGGIDGNSIGYRDGTPNDGIKAINLSLLLRNYYLPARNGNPQKVVTHKPFDFVFLDGCMTAVGSFPEAFGIPKTLRDNYYLTNNKHKRSFMGWNGKLSLAILDTSSLNWSLAFWNSWLGDPTGKTVEQAVTDAFNQYPDAANQAVLTIYGSTSLTWSN
jgi:hypothetical protein